MDKLKGIKKIYWIIAVAVVILAAGSYGAYQLWFKPDEEQISSDSSMQTATAIRGDITLYATGAGTYVAASVVEVGFDLSDDVQEELIELLVEVGDDVEVGDVLARLDDSDRQENLLEAQRALRELTSASALAELEMELAETKIAMQDDIDNLVGLISPAVYKAEGYVDEYAEVLAEAQAAYDADPSDENQEQLNTAERNYKWANSNLEVQWQYYKDEYVPENFEDYYWDGNEKVWFTEGPTDAEIASVRAQISIAEASIEELESLLEALQSGEDIPEEVTGSNATSIRQAQQAVEDALEDLEATNLVAPISGKITQINFEVSEMVGNEVVLVISDLTPPTLETYFDESDWENVKEGFPTEVVFDALPDVVYSGEVVYVDPTLVTSFNTTVIYAEVELNTEQTGWNDLPIGSAAGVDVIGGSTENAVLVPIEALREVSEGEYAVFVVENGQARMTLVEVGLLDLTYAEILSGIDVGDLVSTGTVETAQ